MNRKIDESMKAGMFFERRVNCAATGAEYNRCGTRGAGERAAIERASRSEKDILAFMLFLLLFIFVTSCGHATFESRLPDAANSDISPASFALASDFPADIVIPDIDDMRSTAFIVSTSTPVGVIAVDIDTDPMVVSSKFMGLISPANSGIPSKLLITSTNEAYLLTSTSVVAFDPTSGGVHKVTSITEKISVTGDLKDSSGAAVQSTITPSYPAGIAIVGNRIFVSSANYTRTEAPAVAAPGTVQVFDIVEGHALSRAGHIITTGFNPTGIAVKGDKELVVTNSGVLDIVNAAAVPKTPSSIDIIDTDTLKVTSNIPIGLSALSFQAGALTLDGSRGFFASASEGNVYEVDLINKRVLKGTTDPIKVTSDSDYITQVVLSVDDEYLFAASFEKSSVFSFDISASPYKSAKQFVVGFPSGVTEENPSGANTGAGPMAVRPGSRGTDYNGADLFILTGYPGTLVAVTTDSSAQEFIPEPAGTGGSSSSNNNIVAPPSGKNSEPCQGFAQSVKSAFYGPGSGFGQANFPNVVLGPPHGAGKLLGSTDVLSLGSQGEIILDLGNCPVVDRAGPDFIVFENAFYIGGNESSPYAEPASVAVSSDGVSFVQFSCSPDTYPYTGCAGIHPVYSAPENGISPFDVSAAGGDAFDLATIGAKKVRYIRIRDAKGVGFGTSIGFDLDAISVVNGEINN